MRLIFLGPPGAGKGTQAARLSSHFKLAHIATGDMLRNAVAAGTPLGLAAKTFMERGDLVPDGVSNGLVRERITEKDADKGFILDGYPRNVGQAQELDRALDEIGAKLDKVLRFMVKGPELVQRLSKRRTCPACQAAYHMVTHPPKADGLCDNDGTVLIQREDDREEPILRRLEVYGAQTRPLIEFYQKRGLVADVDAMGTTDQIFQRLLEAIDR